jgi:hypothetical protein
VVATQKRIKELNIMTNSRNLLVLEKLEAIIAEKKLPIKVLKEQAARGFSDFAYQTEHSFSSDTNLERFNESLFREMKELDDSIQ